MDRCAFMSRGQDLCTTLQALRSVGGVVFVGEAPGKDEDKQGLPFHRQDRLTR